MNANSFRTYTIPNLRDFVSTVVLYTSLLIGSSLFDSFWVPLFRVYIKCTRHLCICCTLNELIKRNIRFFPAELIDDKTRKGERETGKIRKQTTDRERKVKIKILRANEKKTLNENNNNEKRYKRRIRRLKNSANQGKIMKLCIVRIQEERRRWNADRN